MAMHHAKSGEVVDLRPLGTKLSETKPTALVKTPSFEAARLIVLAGKEIPPHEVSGNVTLYCLEGRVRISLDHNAIELAAGEWVYLDGGERHSVNGIENASLLMTILFDR
jgi:quercetin dioxygenase-like cupin family protein